MNWYLQLWINQSSGRDSSSPIITVPIPLLGLRVSLVTVLNMMTKVNGRETYLIHLHDLCNYTDSHPIFYIPDWSKDIAKVINDPILCLKNIYEDQAFADTKEETASKSASNHMHATMIKR